MIYEVAFTPECFREIECAQLLDELFFPKRSPPNIYLAKFGSNWMRKVIQETEKLPTHSKLQAQKLLVEIDRNSVIEYPIHEKTQVKDWVQLACSSQYSRILDATFVHPKEATTRADTVHTLELLRDQEWVATTFAHEKDVGYALEEQAHLIKKFWRIADWILVTIPRSQGDTTRDELATALQLIKTAMSDDTGKGRELDIVLRPTPFLDITVERIRDLYCKYPSKISQYLKVNVFQRENLLDRELLGGITRITNLSPNTRLARFYLRPGHFADRRKADSSVRKAKPGIWSLLGRRLQNDHLKVWSESIRNEGPILSLPTK